jgi:hypothetical protein
MPKALISLQIEEKIRAFSSLTGGTDAECTYSYITGYSDSQSEF